MTENNRSIDFVGIGKLAEAIPDESWNTVVNNACETFTKIIYPLTASTNGLGKLIEAKFERMLETEKILTANVVERANSKIKKSEKISSKQIQSSIIIDLIEQSSQENVPGKQEILSNLMANEILNGKVHPMSLDKFRYLSWEDLYNLIIIAEKENENEKIKMFAKIFLNSLLIIPGIILFKEKNDFSHEHLYNLKLIKKVDRFWRLTYTGEKFIEDICLPS